MFSINMDSSSEVSEVGQMETEEAKASPGDESVREKKCPMCTENKTEFGLICKHDICMDCASKLLKLFQCPHDECNKKWVKECNLDLEICWSQLICKFEFEKEGLRHMREHTRTCPRQEVSCFHDACQWSGYLGKMQKHFMDSHSNGTATYFVHAGPEINDLARDLQKRDHRILFAYNCFFDANFVMLRQGDDDYRLLVHVALVEPRDPSYTDYFYKITILNQHGKVVLDYKSLCLKYSESDTLDRVGAYGFTCGVDVLDQFWGDHGFVICKVEICVKPVVERPKVIINPQDDTMADSTIFCSPYESITYLSKPGHIYYDVIIRLTEIISSGLNVEFAARTLHDILFDKNLTKNETVALSEFFVGLALGPDNFKILLSLIKHQNYQVVQNASKITGLIIKGGRKLRNIIIQNKKIIPEIFSRLYEFKEGFLCEKSSYKENLKITESMCATLNLFLSNANKNQFCHFLSIEDMYPKLCFLYEEYTKRKHWEIVRELTDMVNELIELASRYKNKTVLKKLRQHGAEDTVGSILYGSNERKYERAGLCRIILKDIQRYFDGVYV